MTERLFHTGMCLGIIGVGVLTFLVLLFVSAPYGRHTRKGWGPTLPSRWGWILMETPPVLFFIWVFAWGTHRWEWVPLIFLGLWQLHYIHRAYIFPFRMRSQGKRMPLLVMSLALLFNFPNAYINARWISEWGGYDPTWLTDPRFVLGVVIFLVGLCINLHADTVLLHLRRPGETGYIIPKGGLYRWVSCPNYLGEIIEWTGWAIATWSLAGLAFALYTIANLAPRALTHHQWYQETFDDYPAQRKALIPFLL